MASQPVKRRFAKSQLEYQKRAAAFAQRWSTVASLLPQAKRFQDEFHAAVAELS
jgi:hypothetical protein